MGTEIINVVIAEDEFFIRQDLEMAVTQAGFNVVGVAGDGQAAIELVEQLRPSLVMLDIKMPRMDGLEAAAHIQEHYDIPTILLTAYESESFLELAKQAGVSSYLIKPPEIGRLKRAIALAMTQHQDKMHLKQLLDQAHIDPLTGVANRRRFSEVYATEVERINRYGGQLPTLALLDIDHFKMVNDRYGHACGDQVLKTFAETLKNTLRASDFICRWGGEEFAVLLPETRPDQAVTLLDRLRVTIGRLLFSSPVQEFSVTVSAGVSATTSATLTLDEVVNHADMALYEAKNKGRNRVKYFDHSSLAFVDN